MSILPFQYLHHVKNVVYFHSYSKRVTCVVRHIGYGDVNGVADCDPSQWYSHMYNRDEGYVVETL